MQRHVRSRLLTVRIRIIFTKAKIRRFEDRSYNKLPIELDCKIIEYFVVLNSDYLKNMNPISNREGHSSTAVCRGYIAVYTRSCRDHDVGIHS